jgi:hypothetical protein
VPLSNSGRMCGCCSPAVTSISLRKRSGPSTADSSGCSTLSATRRRWRRSRARYTVGHAAASQLALDLVPPVERGPQMPHGPLGARHLHASPSVGCRAMIGARARPGQREAPRRASCASRAHVEEGAAAAGGAEQPLARRA